MQLTELEKEQLEVAKALPNEVLKLAVKYRVENGLMSEADCTAMANSSAMTARQVRQSAAA